MKPKHILTVILTIGILIVGVGAPVGQAAQLQDEVNAPDTIFLITASNLQGWFFNNPGGTGFWNFIKGPGTAPLGNGSVRLEISPTDYLLFYKYGFSAGTRLADLTLLKYSTYQDSASPGAVNDLPALSISIDDDLSSGSTEAGFLFYEPFQTPGNVPAKGAWQTWDTLVGRWWAASPPVSGTCPRSAPCTWSTLIATYPNIGVSSTNPEVWFQVGAGWGISTGWASGFIGNVDNFIFGADTYNFDPSDPAAYSQKVTTTEDTAKAITLTADDFHGYPLTWRILSNPTHGTLSGTAPNVTYTPAANYSGPDSFTFDVYDDVTNSNTATVSITVTAVNDAPVANGQSVSTAEDTAKAITLTASDVEGSPLTWSIVANPTHGALSGTAPNVTYTPAANYYGADSFTFRVNDGTTNSNTATVSITVTPVDDVPVANGQSVSTAEDTAKAITLTATELDGDPLTWSVLTTPTHGALSGTAPNVTYTPAANYSGPDSFTFRVNDGKTNSNTATVSITVTAVNDPPVANGQSVSTAEETAKAITLTASDVEGSPLTWSIVANPTHGALSGTAPNVTYTPAANYYGADSFTFRVNDGTTDSNTATVSITVTPVDDVPVANGQSVSTAEDTAKAITLTATELDGDPLTWSVLTTPTHGALSGTAPNVTYTPAANYSGPDSFTFRVNDGKTNSNTATVSITVTAVNDPPVANGQSVSTAEETAKAITLTASDVEGSPLTWSIVANPTHGTLSGTAPNVTYTPAANYYGADSFTFRVNDGTTNSNTATVSITVTPVDDVPVANNQSVSTAEDTAKAITLTATELDGDPLTWSILTTPTHGTLSGTAPNVTYTPAANYNGPDSFTFRVNDGTTNSNTATVSITVTAVNDKPVAVNDAFSMYENGVLIKPAPGVLSNDTDQENDPLTAILNVGPTHGTLTINEDGSFVYTPNNNYFGTDSFTYHTNDGALNSNSSATVTITVSPGILYLPLVNR